MLVIVAVVQGVSMTVMDVIHVVTVLNCLVTAAVPVFVGMTAVFVVPLRFAFVVVPVMSAVKMPVMRIVHMVTMLDSGMPAPRPMGMLMLCVLKMCRRHRTLLFQYLVS
ncbi:hypothetical protein JMUB6875_58340 [Nocardia sp. JMUB6875]